jgi:hypothetical protein
MANEPMPWQLTVAALRKAIETAPDEAVVGLAVPPGGLGDPDLQVFYNLRVSYAGGVVVTLKPNLDRSAPTAG